MANALIVVRVDNLVKKRALKNGQINNLMLRCRHSVVLANSKNQNNDKFSIKKSV